MYKARAWYKERMVQLAMRNLTKNGFTPFYVSSKDEGCKKGLELIPQTAKIGVGGSITVREIGLVKALVHRGNQVVEWRAGLTEEEEKMLYRTQLTSDVFLTSSNAITLDGKVVNVDATGNRVAAMICGPMEVIIMAGVNKLVPTVESGLQRIRNLASPINAHHHQYKSPCSVTGCCDEHHCELPGRICHILTIIERRPKHTPTTVVLIGEQLGY
jgi:L-lactate utilization protein LutB